MVRTTLLLLIASVLPVMTWADVRPAIVVLLEGDAVAGSTVSSLNTPFTDGNGVVGFAGGLVDDDRFVWYDGAVRWFNSDALPADTLTGAEGTMGIGDNGEFVYSPSVGGDDAVWSHNGLVLMKGLPAPGYAVGTTNTFNSRPTMTPDGTAHWVAGVNASGGSTTENRVVYAAPDALPAGIIPILKTGDLVGGFPISAPSGIGFQYWVSDSHSHHIHMLELDTGSSANNGIVYLDGAIVARESFPTGDGDNWSNFATVAVNDGGDYVIAGDTDGAAATDAYVAYNGTIEVREGDTLDGFPLTSSASVRAVSINNAGFVAQIWAVSGGVEALFVGRGEDIVGSSMRIIATGDSVDVDQDGSADFVVTDLSAAASAQHSLDMATGMMVFAGVELTPVGGGTATDGVVGFPACASPLTLTGVVVGPNQLMLQWSACPRVHEYWVHGATNDPFFAPGFAPGYENRLAVLPPADLDEAVPGPGDPSDNGTYLVVAVTPGGVEMTRSNRFGEFDFVTGGP